MTRTDGSSQDPGTHVSHFQDDDQQNQHQPQGGQPAAGRKLATKLQLPKNRSTGNLSAVLENDSDIEDHKPLFRFSFDAGASPIESDFAPSRSTSIISEHDHGLGLSGLRRIRQNPAPRSPVIPSSAISPNKSDTNLARSVSLNMIFPQGPLVTGSRSPNFAEDLSRFPSESLHSFSFAHRSDDLIQSRQNVLKRSIEFMKDRMGWAIPSNTTYTNAQPRAIGDVETQHIYANAQLAGAGNMHNVDLALLAGPLSGPANLSGNPFDQEFIFRTSSPDSYATPIESPGAVPSPNLLPEKALKLITQPENEKAGPLDMKIQHLQNDSEIPSRTPSDNTDSIATTSQPVTRPASLRRTVTDISTAGVQQTFLDVMAQQPFSGAEFNHYPEIPVSPAGASRSFASLMQSGALGPAVHGHSSRWVPAAQAIFTTESQPPWTIIAANDLACLVFGVTKAEVRKVGIMEVVQEERRGWLEKKLLQTDFEAEDQVDSNVTSAQPAPSVGSTLLGNRGGITAQLLNKPNSRSQPPKPPIRRAVTIHNSDPSAPKTRGPNSSRSRGVLLCGDVVPIQKRNGATGSASLWVKEKKVGLIWVLEEIHEDVAFLRLDEDGIVTSITGNTMPIWGQETLAPGIDVGNLITRIPRQGIDPRFGAVDYAQIAKRKYFTSHNSVNVNTPVTVAQTRGQMELRVSCFPHIAGIVVVSTNTLLIKSSNSAFCGALFGYEKAEGQPINALLPDFDKILQVLQRQDGIQIREGMVIPEHSFRKASALVGIHEGRPDAASNFLRPNGLVGKHRDGTELNIDVQMRVVKSEKHSRHDSGSSSDASSSDEAAESSVESEMVFALWITYSRHIHASKSLPGAASPSMSGFVTPPRQPSPGQTPAHTPPAIASDSEDNKSTILPVKASLPSQLKDVAISAAKKLVGVTDSAEMKISTSNLEVATTPKKKTINNFVILEDMGQGAYGQVKLARYKHNGGKKVVLKYVTKRRILVDTWTRDRRLGTVPLEIHVLDYLRRGGLKHPNVVEMEDFFEDETNYYIEMTPHGLPGMDLFDYIELRANMDEDECRSIFVQVAEAIHHLHTKAKVVHRDIKDENVVLDGEGNIKLIDFGSAAYIKSGPFDVFVGTIDYAAPEVLAGKPYGGKEQDVWALGILLYTIIYKENPFYSIDEIMDRDLRIPYIISEESIDLIRCMLNRDLSKRYDIDQVLQHPWCRRK